jgi:hypothetical protein
MRRSPGREEKENEKEKEFAAFSALFLFLSSCP